MSLKNYVQEPSEEPFDIDSVPKEVKSLPLAEKKAPGKKPTGLGAAPTAPTSTVDAYEKLLSSIPEFSSFGKLFKAEKMVLVACGWRHTISVSSSGGLYTYGWSKYGQLGHGDFEDHLIPHRLEALRENFISRISGGWRHTMALTSDGKLYGWGWNKGCWLNLIDKSKMALEVVNPHEEVVLE